MSDMADIDRVAYAEGWLTGVLRDGVMAQQAGPGGYCRLVQGGLAAVVDGGINFRELARFVLEAEAGSPMVPE